MPGDLDTVFTAKRIRRLARLVGAACPHDDDVTIHCVGAVAGRITRKVERLIDDKKQLADALDLVYGMYLNSVDHIEEYKLPHVEKLLKGLKDV